MRVRQHGAHLTWLERYRQFNCYLVREPEGLTVIDTMVRGSAETIVRVAAVIGVPVARIAVTHAHWDHAGSLDALAEALPDAEVAFPARDARFLAGDKGLDPGERDRKPPGMVTVTRRPDVLLSAGDRFGSLEVVPAPGHTPGQIALLDTRDRTLMAADAYSTLGGVAVSSKPNPRFPFPALGTWDHELALQTGWELRALEPSRLAPGHGPVVESPLDAMDRALARAA